LPKAIRWLIRSLGCRPNVSFSLFSLGFEFLSFVLVFSLAWIFRSLSVLTLFIFNLILVEQCPNVVVASQKMLNFWYDTGPPSTSWDSDDNEELPDADTQHESIDPLSPNSTQISQFKMRQRRRSRWRQSSDYSDQSFNPRKFLLFILAFALLPTCSSGRTTNAPSFKSDPSVLITFSDTFENKDVELEKMASFFGYNINYSKFLDHGSAHK
jgi:hypothetical protein